MRKLHLRKIANVSDLSVGGSFPQAIAEAGVISFTGNRGFFHCSVGLREGCLICCARGELMLYYMFVFVQACITCCILV